MKKTFLFIIFAIICSSACAQNTTNDTVAVRILPENSNNIRDEIAAQDSTVQTLYLCGMILALFGCVAIHYIYKKRQQEYAVVVNSLNQQLTKQKLQCDSFGYILNSLLIPCCLVKADGKIVWRNDAFENFYGKNINDFDILSGVQSNEDIAKIRGSKFAMSFFVKSRNTADKVVGYQRTLIPLPSSTNGTINYAIVENIM